ncbi:hypothetical protein QR98_0049650 [Sarcoptes scabiei]|uniref:Uncharacterized protein n=1 Tax=Sarcoptes scabiei TaxID=52283 RepID=A0A132A692_SARSC|nr:hypothetical protein QR98_0049650 [Sarcoptes scabiei]
MVCMARILARYWDSTQASAHARLQVRVRACFLNVIVRSALHREGGRLRGWPRRGVRGRDVACSA